MKIVKASAGSGNTYTLAHTYIGLLMDSPDRYAYRHILAVTFTNKATAEMKGRILSDLYKESADNPKAKAILTDILHDYSAFAVSTIDKFFQTTLKAFSREIGQFASYQLELDRDSITAEAMDRILDSLTEDKEELLGWLKECVKEKVEAGERYNLNEELYTMAKQLKSEEFRQLVETVGTDSLDKTRLAALHRHCRGIIRDFESKAAAFGLRPEPSGAYKMPGKKALAADADLSELFGRPFEVYNTARDIDKHTYNLGLAGEFLREFNSLLKEKNLMCLDESNTILRDIIDGSDAPFIYEKLGVRYEHFLLDEFQDTSNIQWDNFKPLLHESEDNGCESLIVGDVKQSIYRWRDSDWNLLNSRVSEEFPGEAPKSLDCNWRSCRQIVHFNNDFFTYAAEALGISDIYSDVRQEPRTDDGQEGFVRVSFADDQEKVVLESIAAAREAGAGWNDIAILVRDHTDGASIAEALIREGYPVISDDSLNLKSSVTVRRLVSLLSGFDNPEDSIGRFLSASLNIDWPEQYFSLADLCEALLRQLKALDPELFEGETLFVQTFMDDVKNWTEANGNNLKAYLQHWKDATIYVGSPEDSASIRVITIHKSKGLEFPYVIFPYAESVKLFRHNTHWCRIEGEGLDGIYPFPLSSRSENTMYAESYRKEYYLQTVDNLNIFYVALTRAAKCLHVIASEPSKTFREGLAKGHPKYSSLSEILYAFSGACSDRSYGTMYDFNLMERDSRLKDNTFPAVYESIPLGGRLQPSTDAADFFGEEGITGPGASPRLEGIILHGILSEVREASDLKAAVDGAVASGAIDRSRGEEAFKLLSERIGAHPEWFGKVKSGNEVTIIGDDGQCHRPDRVIKDGGSITIIDYKFGEERPSHRRQVSEYVRLYRKMGYSDVKGVVWYVRRDECVILA